MPHVILLAKWSDWKAPLERKQKEKEYFELAHNRRVGCVLATFCEKVDLYEGVCGILSSSLGNTDGCEKTKSPEICSNVLRRLRASRLAV